MRAIFGVQSVSKRSMNFYLGQLAQLLTCCVFLHGYYINRTASILDVPIWHNKPCGFIYFLPNLVLSWMLSNLIQLITFLLAVQWILVCARCVLFRYSSDMNRAGLICKLHQTYLYPVSQIASWCSSQQQDLKLHKTCLWLGVNSTSLHCLNLYPKAFVLSSVSQIACSFWLMDEWINRHDSWTPNQYYFLRKTFYIRISYNTVLNPIFYFIDSFVPSNNYPKSFIYSAIHYKIIHIIITKEHTSSSYFSVFVNRSHPKRLHISFLTFQRSHNHKPAAWIMFITE